MNGNNTNVIHSNGSKVLHGSGDNDSNDNHQQLQYHQNGNGVMNEEDNDFNEYTIEGYRFQYNDQHHAYEYHEDVPSWLRTYFHFIEKNRKYIFIFWCIILLISMLVGPEFLVLGDDQVGAPHGSEAWKAQNLFDARFKVQATEVPQIVLSFCKPNTDCNDIRNDDMRLFSKEFVKRVKDYNETHDVTIIDIMDYFSFEGTLLNDIKEQFISPDHRMTIMNIAVSSEDPTNNRRDFLEWMDEQIAELNPDKSKYDIGITGFDAMFKDSTESTADEMTKIDSVTLPLAFVILAVMIRSWRLLLIGIFNMLTSLLFAFTLLVCLIKTTGKHPESTSAQLTQVMSLALSLDYSLFLNRRFRDEIKIGASPRKAAFMSLLHAGHVVVMSGSTIVIVFLGFTILPARTIQLDGINCAIAITVSMLVALTNTPAMHLLFPGFFSDFDIRCCRKGASKRDCFDITPPVKVQSAVVSNVQNGDYTLHEENDDVRNVNDDNNESSSIAKREVHNMYKSPRFRFTRMIVQWPCNIIAVILMYIVVLPFAYNATRMNINQDILVGLPRKAGSSKRFKEMVKAFSPGSFAPFYVLIALPENGNYHSDMLPQLESEDEQVGDMAATNSVLSEEFFKMAGNLAQDVIDRVHQHDERFTAANLQSPVLANGMKTTYNEARVLLGLANSKKCNSNPTDDASRKACTVAKEYQFLWNQSVNPTKDAMVFMVTVPFFPFAQESAKFIDVVQSVLDEATEKYTKGENAQFEGTEYHFCGFEVGFNALSSHVYHLFPTLLAVTLTGVFIVLGVLLRSAFVVVRLSLTLLLPITAVYGAAVLVYQDGVLEWLAESTGKSGGFFWYVPILITSMLVGLALDYDVFLISRVMEHRAAGYDIQAAVVKGVCETGGTIAAAGIIMTLVFGGLLLGDGLTINICGWMLATGVLVDTFVVNTVLVPALLSLGDSVAWWPTKMPLVNLKGLDDPEFPQE